jgi:hypothetical protein
MSYGTLGRASSPRCKEIRHQRALLPAVGDPARHRKLHHPNPLQRCVRLVGRTSPSQRERPARENEEYVDRRDRISHRLQIQSPAA